MSSDNYITLYVDGEPIGCTTEAILPPQPYPVICTGPEKEWTVEVNKLPSAITTTIKVQRLKYRTTEDSVIISIVRRVPRKTKKQQKRVGAYLSDRHAFNCLRTYYNLNTNER